MAKCFNSMTCDEKAKFITDALVKLAVKGNVIEVSLAGSDTTKFSSASRGRFIDLVRVAAINCPQVKEILTAIEEPTARRYGCGIPVFGCHR